MPHQIIEYSANLESDIDFDDLARVLHDTAVGIEALPVGGIRTRAARREIYRIADGDPDYGFIYLTLRIVEGRPSELQQEIGETLFAALRDYVADVCQRRPLALTLEIQEIDSERRWKASNIRDYMARRTRARPQASGAGGSGDD